MRPLLQHASRSLTTGVASIASSSIRSVRELIEQAPSRCLRCQYRAASISLRGSTIRPLSSEIPQGWSQRSFSNAARWLEEKGASDPSKTIPMPPPTSESKPTPAGRPEDRAPKTPSHIEGQDRLQENPDTSLESQADGSRASTGRDTAPEEVRAQKVERQPPSPLDAKEQDVADNIARVPDEHLPSHRERQRWDFSKRLSELMDDLLPKLAVVTQKVNTYTGTDYSGVEALRREIMEQEKLVKARRAAIDTAKQALDTAHAGQASAQKEVVALLERKHSWSAQDLERYMSLIRSEHINDQAIRQAKDRVISAEAALEEARTQLEKRERAQYHEEQIWSDTIRRNSTWVTFVLMGVNILLLLLSLAVLEPWRRRRMVREIKGALEAQKVAIETAPATAAATMSAVASKELAAIEEEIDQVIEPANSAPKPASPVTTSVADEISPTKEAEIPSVLEDVPQTVLDPRPDAAVPGAASLTPGEAASSPQASIDIVEEASAPDVPSGTLRKWQSNITTVAQDVISDRIISMRRIDYTMAILQGAAAGAIITGAIIAILRPN